MTILAHITYVGTVCLIAKLLGHTKILAHSLWKANVLLSTTTKNLWHTIYFNSLRRPKMFGDITCTALRSASLQCGRFCCIFLHWNLYIYVLHWMTKHKGYVHTNQTHTIMPCFLKLVKLNENILVWLMNNQIYLDQLPRRYQLCWQTGGWIPSWPPWEFILYITPENQYHMYITPEGSYCISPLRTYIIYHP